MKIIEVYLLLVLLFIGLAGSKNIFSALGKDLADDLEQYEELTKWKN